MTEPVDVLILNALMARLTVPALTSPATPIASPLVTYTPATNVPYLDVHPVMRAEPDRRALAFTAAGATLRRGIFQVDAVAPDGKGESPGLRLAAFVAARFAIGTQLVAGSYRLQLDKEPKIATAVPDAPWVRFPVSIPILIIT